MEGVAKKKAIKVRNPLEPLMTANRMMLRLLALAFVAAVVALPFGHGTLLGWGRPDICVGTDGMGGADASGTASFVLPRAGVALAAKGLMLCSDRPSAGQRWWYTLEQLPTTATVVVVVLVTYLTLRQARQHGLYTPGIATRLRFLGWFLVVDSVLQPVVEVYASHRLWDAMAGSTMPINGSPVWAFLFAGVALLSLARIMAVGSDMREELEGLV